jgi:cardiolipin synthase
VPGEPERADRPDAGLVRRASTELVRYIDEPRELIAGNAVRLLRNGSAVFPRWIEAIDGARQRVSMEMYIFADDKIGERVADALCRAARRGVTVRLLYDFIGCRFTSPAFFMRLRRAGVHTIVYHAYRFWRPRFWTLFRRNHRKTLVCDGQVAFTGGVNIADEWLPVEEGGGGWLDSAVELRGPAVPVLEAEFLRVWNRRARRRARLDPTTLAAPAAAGDTRLAIVSNTELLNRFAIRRAAIHALRESRTRALLANPYFVPDRGFLRALCQAAARGVDVRLLVPARSDHAFLDYAARATFTNLLKSGVRIYEHRRVVHSKALLVDDDFVSLGSYNLDHWSLAYNLEVVVNTLDRPYHADVLRMLEEDMGSAEEITLERFRQRPLLDRLLEKLAYKLRLWL